MNSKKALCLAVLVLVVLSACAFPTLARPTEATTFTEVPSQTPTQVPTPRPSPTPTAVVIPTATPNFNFFGGQMIYYLPGITGITLSNGKKSDPLRYVQVSVGITPGVANYYGRKTECPGYTDWGLFAFIVPPGAGNHLTLADYKGYYTFTEFDPKTIFYLVVGLSRNRSDLGAVNSVVYIDNTGKVVGDVAPDLQKVFLDTATQSLKFKGYEFLLFQAHDCTTYMSVAAYVELIGSPKQ